MLNNFTDIEMKQNATEVLIIAGSPAWETSQNIHKNIERLCQLLDEHPLDPRFEEICSYSDCSWVPFRGMTNQNSNFYKQASFFGNLNDVDCKFNIVAIRGSKAEQMLSKAIQNNISKRNYQLLAYKKYSDHLVIEKLDGTNQRFLVSKTEWVNIQKGEHDLEFELHKLVEPRFKKADKNTLTRSGVDPQDSCLA